MTESADAELLDEAVELTREAGQLTLSWFNNHELSVSRKDDGSPVTEADKAAESFLREALAKRFPRRRGDRRGVPRTTRHVRANLDHRPHRRHP